MKFLAKHTLKTSLLFFVVFSFINCEKENYETSKQLQEDLPFSVKMVPKDFIDENLKIKEELNKILPKKKENNQLNSRQIYNSEYDFYVETEYARYIESTDGSFHSYTFPIVKDGEANITENLIFSLQEDGTYHTMVVEYEKIADGNVKVRTIPLEIDNIDDYTNNEVNRLEYFGGCLYDVTFDYYCYNCGSANPEWVVVESYFEVLCDGETAGGVIIQDTAPAGEVVYIGYDWQNNNGQDLEAFGDNVIMYGGGNLGNNTTDNSDFFNQVATSYTPPIFSREFYNFINNDLTQEQFNYVNNFGTLMIKLEIQNFFNINGVNESSKQFVKDAIDALNDDGTVDFKNKIINVIENPCQRAIVDAANRTKSSLSQALLAIFEPTDAQQQAFDESLPEFSYFIINAFYSLDEAAGTEPFPECEVGHCQIKTTFNDAYLLTATDLSLAATAIHESVHAMLAYKFRVGELVIDGNTDPTLDELLVAYTEYAVLTNYQNSSLDADELNAAQHNYMVQLIDDMANSLYLWALTTNTGNGHNPYNPADFIEFDTEADGDGLKEYCRMLFWGPSLQTTNNFEEEFPNEATRKKVKNINKAEMEGDIQTYTITASNGTTHTYTVLPKGNPSINEATCN